MYVENGRDEMHRREIGGGIGRACARGTLASLFFSFLFFRICSADKLCASRISSAALPARLAVPFVVVVGFPEESELRITASPPISYMYARRSPQRSHYAVSRRPLPRESLTLPLHQDSKNCDGDRQPEARGRRQRGGLRGDVLPRHGQLRLRRQGAPPRHRRVRRHQARRRSRPLPGTIGGGGA